MYFLRINAGRFELIDTNDKSTFFDGTVLGAIECYSVCKHLGNVSISSDLNHPDEFTDFEEYAIDLAAGRIEDALRAGVIDKLFTKEL